MVKIFSGKRKFISIPILCVVILLGAFNLAMFVYALVEKGSDLGKNEEWVSSAREFAASLKPLDRSAILVHGFTGSPFDFKPIAEKLSKIGFNVVVPVVPGQTKETFAYKRSSYTPEFYVRWLSDIVEQETKRFNKKPYLVGHSMGGTISTIIASKNAVERLILIAPFYSLAGQNSAISNFAGALKWVIPLLPKRNVSINDPSGLEVYVAGSYIISVGAFENLQKLALHARQVADNVTVPTLILSSSRDETASFPVTKQLFTNMANVRIIDFSDSNHILLYDYNRNEVVSEIIGFLSDGNKTTQKAN